MAFRKGFSAATGAWVLGIDGLVNSGHISFLRFISTNILILSIRLDEYLSSK